MWWSASIETKPFKSNRVAEREFFKKFRAQLELGHRRHENLLWTQQTYLDVTAKYRFKKWFRMAVTYRYSARDKYSMNRQRFVVDASLRKKMKRYRFSYRLRYQHNFGPLPPIPDLKSIRNKFKLAYNIRKCPIDPWISAEILTSFNYLGTNLKATRYQVGANYNMDKGHSIDIAYRHQRQIGVYLPTYENIISISYAYYLK